MSADPGNRAESEKSADSQKGEATPVTETETEWQRRRRLAAVFGDVLPETTADERDESESGTSEEWLKGQVPPHHG